MVKDLANRGGFNVIKGSDGSQCCVFSKILLCDLKRKKFDLLVVCVFHVLILCWNILSCGT